jgi:tetratricopeptide (TPR) repeat protein
MGEYTRSLEYDKKALEIRLNVLGESSLDTARSLINIGVVYSRLRRYGEALEHAEKGLGLVLSEHHPEMVSGLINVGSIYYKMGNAKRAQEYTQRGLRLARELLGDQHVDTIQAVVSMATLLCNLGQPRQGLQLLEEMLPKVPPDNPRYDWLKQKHVWVRNQVPGLRHLSASGQRQKKKRKKR